MILKIYQTTEFSRLKEIIKIIKESMENFYEICSCIQIHYDGSKKTYFLSLNCKYNENFYKIQDIEEKFRTIDSKVRNLCTEIDDEYKHVYLSLFDGIDNFLIQIMKNHIYLFDTMTKENLLNIALFQIMLHNLDVASDFFKFIDDLSFKMKLKFDLFFFIKEENNFLFFKSVLAYVEKNRIKFIDNLEKFSNFNALNVMLNPLPVDKKNLTELFIRKVLNDDFEFKTEEQLDFLSKHVKDVAPQAEEKQKCSPGNPVNGLESEKNMILHHNAKAIEDVIKRAFKTRLLEFYPNGNFIDPQQCVYATGTDLFVLVNGLVIKAFLNLLKEHLSHRKILLIFCDGKEIVEFNNHFCPKIDGIYDTTIFADFLETH